jgi:two-component system phosphate regulon response regulator PhoB
MHLPSDRHPSVSLRALVVDDDPGYRYLVEQMLGEHGIRTVQWTPEQADPVALARAERPDVVLLDWRLPGTPGVELCRRLRSDPEVGETPVIMLTGLDDHRDATTARRAGADAFLTKGCGAGALAAVIRRVHDQAAEQREPPAGGRTG